MDNREKQSLPEYDLEIHGTQEKITPARERYIRKKTGEAIRMYYKTGKLPVVRKNKKNEPIKRKGAKKP